MAVRNGDFSVRLAGDRSGIAGKIADTFNDIVSAKERLATELERVGDAVGKRGLTRRRVQCERWSGAWGAMETSVNGLIDDLLQPTIEVTRSIAAVAKGDLSQTVPLEIEGLSLQEDNAVLAGKKILVVDDDVRNIFALSSVLERYNMTAIAAHTGRDAIRLLEQSADISLVLLDIMMPEMDGYETMRGIRDNAQLQMLPIITLTAKAMKGDREKCLEAGASDYIAKPVDSGLPDIDGYEVARRLRADERFTEVPLIALTGFCGQADRVRAERAGFDDYLVKPVPYEMLAEVLAAKASAVPQARLSATRPANRAHP